MLLLRFQHIIIHFMHRSTLLKHFQMFIFSVIKAFLTG